MTDNVHKVPTKQWRRWSDETRVVFNRLYPQLADGFMTTLLPPSLYQQITPKQAKVLAWNAAWLAADEMEKAISESLLAASQ